MKRALSMVPEVPETTRFLLRTAAELVRQGHGQEAEILYRHILTAHGHLADAIGELGHLVQQRGELDSARAYFGLALLLEPEHPEVCNNLGVLASTQGAKLEALSWFKKALKSRPDSVVALNNLGLTLEDLGHHEMVETVFRSVLALDGQNIQGLCGLGMALSRQQRWGEALACLERAVERSSGTPSVYNDLALHHFLRAEADPSQTEALEKAVTIARQTLAIEPNNLDALFMVGTSLVLLGSVTEGATMLDHVIRLNPGMARAHYHRSIIRSAWSDADCAHARALLAQARTDGERIDFHFTLGKILVDRREYLASMVHFHEGNRLIRQGYTYDESAQRASFEAYARGIDHDFLQTRAGWGDPDDSVVFVIGMPRSGTTLIEQILASHSQVHGAGELEQLLKVLKTWLPDPEAGPRGGETLDQADWAAMGREYLSGLPRIAHGKRLVVDKMPLNFRFAGLIRLMLPNARIIHAVRSPLDTCLSIYQSKFITPSLRWTFDLAEIGHYYRMYKALMDHWHRVMAGQILEVRYEALIQNQEQQTRRMLEHCGLEWEEGCMRFHETRRSVRTASLSQVTRPMYGNSVGRWQHYGEMLRPLLDVLDPL
ncbi:MAG: sulfotransferase [Magnetococcales bacterium]|nr:sulfotransferase [Magnetococcales bacterium]